MADLFALGEIVVMHESVVVWKTLEELNACSQQTNELLRWHLSTES